MTVIEGKNCQRAWSGISECPVFRFRGQGLIWLEYMREMRLLLTP